MLRGREDALHVLGGPLPTVATAEEAMRHAKLDKWKIRKLPLTFTTETGLVVRAADRFAVVRNIPGKRGQVGFLGDVGPAYKAWQNEELCPLLNAIVDESGCTFETIGSWDDGRTIFLALKLPGHVKIGSDPVDLYITVVTSHDGGMSHTFIVTPVRRSGKSLLNAEYRGQSGVFKVRHSRRAELHARARQILDFAFDYLDAFQADTNKLAEKPFSQAQFERQIVREFGAKEHAALATVTRCDNKIEQMAALFADKDNTAWEAFNALTEWADHFSPTRGDNRDHDRAVKAVLDPAFKTKAFEMMLV